MLRLLLAEVEQPVGLDMSGIMQLALPLVAVVAVFYFMMIRPEGKRKKAMQKMLSELKVGDTVTTRGGVVGKVVSIKDDKLTIKTGGATDGATVQVMRWAINTTGSSGTEPV